MGHAMWQHVFALTIWAVQYITRLLIKLMPKGVVFSFLFLSFLLGNTDLLVCLVHIVAASDLKASPSQKGGGSILRR